MTSAPGFVENRAFGPERAADGLLPDAARLDRARDLAARFAHAGLAPCAVVPAPIRSTRARLWLACESLQITGSFKVRGALFALDALRGTGAPVEVVAASAGNHGAGLAYAASVLGARATIVVPKTAARTKVDKIASYGASVVYAAEPGYDGAEREAIDLARARGVPYVSPYDDLDVIAGNGASLGFEIVRALGRVPDAVVCPIGGGGLATGIACALAREAGGAEPRTFGVQTDASPAFALSLERGAAVTELPPAETLAEGLEGGLPERAFARLRAVIGGTFVVPERAIAEAMRYAARAIGLVLEGSAAAAIAPVVATPDADETLARVLDASRRATPADAHDGAIRDVVFVLTGRNVDRERLVEVC